MKAAKFYNRKRLEGCKENMDFQDYGEQISLIRIFDLFTSQFSCSIDSHYGFDINYEDLFKNESICMDEDEINCINPDDFLNLSALDHFECESPSEESTGSMIDHQYSIQTTQQLTSLTPPISPQPNNLVAIDNSDLHKVRVIPITFLQQRQQQPQTSPKRVKTIIPKPSSSSDSDSTVQATCPTTPKTSNSPVDKVLMKQQRLIRNRESAIISRNKKKLYVQSLESQNFELRKENTMLKKENSQLKERMKSYSDLTCRCASSLSTKLPSKNATLMLAVLFMVGFNFMPFSNLVFKATTGEPLPVQQFNTRHLLVLQNSSSSASENISSSEEVNEEVYFNQTDQIRKVNIENIRRWIPEPDLFNVSYVQKDFEINTDPLQDKLAKMYEKSREQSQKHAKNKKRVSKKRPVMGPVQQQRPPVQLYDSNLNIIKLNEFFDEIDRKDDTFYVFSFRADHILLPAIDSKYNFSQIKMNLIMPRSNGKCHNQIFVELLIIPISLNSDSSSSDKITMMQIETIILNTSLIQITEKSIPENFLKSNSNSSYCSENSFAGSEEVKKGSLNDTAPIPQSDAFQPIKATRFPSYFNTVDLLNPKKPN